MGLSLVYTPDTTAPIRLDWQVLIAAGYFDTSWHPGNGQFYISRYQSGVDTIITPIMGGYFPNAGSNVAFNSFGGVYFDNVANTLVRTYRLWWVSGLNSMQILAGSLLAVQEQKK